MPAWLVALDRHFPIRYLTMTLAAAMAMLGCFAWVGFDRLGWLALLGVAAFVIGARDLLQVLFTDRSQQSGVEFLLPLDLSPLGALRNREIIT